MSKEKEFKEELRQLLKKYNAEIYTEDFGSPCSGDNKIVVDFRWDADKEEESTPQLIIGTYMDGDL